MTERVLAENEMLKKKIDALKNKFKEYDQPPLGMTRSKIVEQMRKILKAGT